MVTPLAEKPLPSISIRLEDPSLADGEGGLKKIPFKETRRYVKRVKRVWGIYDRLYGEEKPSETLSPAS